MGQLNDFPGEPLGDGLLEQDMGEMIGDLRRNLGGGEESPGYAEQQLSGFGNTTRSLIVLEKGASLTDQQLEDAALSLLVLEGRIHFQTEDAHLHPDEGTSLFALPGQPYEIQAVEPSVLVATFMRFG